MAQPRKHTSRSNLPPQAQGQATPSPRATQKPGLSEPAPRRIEIYDTTLRDGTEGPGVSLSLVDKLAITQLLDDLGVDYVEGGYPLINPKDVDYFKQVRDLDLKGRHGPLNKKRK